MLTHEHLTHLITYYHETGTFVRNVRVGRSPAGLMALKPSPGGYLRMRIDGKHYYAHRLAWFYIHKEWPKGEVDHINGNKTDNRLSNLRDVTTRENTHNRSVYRAGRPIGGSYCDQKRKWRVVIYADGEHHHIGWYDTREQASAAYAVALLELTGRSPLGPT